MANLAGRNLLNAVVLREITPSTSLVRVSRHIHDFRITNKNVYSKQPEKIQEASQNVFDFCEEVGVNDLGAWEAETKGPAHENSGDKDEPWNRLTISLKNKEGKQMIFSGGGKTWDRLHIATDRKHWYPKGHFKLKELRDMPADKSK